MRRVLAAVLLTGLFAACTGPGLIVTSGGTVGAIRANAEPIHVVVAYLEAAPGARVELVDAVVVDPPAGANVGLFLSPPIQLGGSWVIGVERDPLPGQVLTAQPDSTAGPGNEVGVLAELTPGGIGIYRLTTIEVRYRLNGGPTERVRVGFSFSACVGYPTPAECPVETAPPTQ
ncbi:MAG TPA: hypothetical protein VNH13_07080 [Candidatus Acidoferrales bacterium]|nr:hypothetical protein [Candidatus Acidoferrales bacterium]